MPPRATKKSTLLSAKMKRAIREESKQLKPFSGTRRMLRDNEIQILLTKMVANEKEFHPLPIVPFAVFVDMVVSAESQELISAFAGLLGNMAKYMAIVINTSTGEEESSEHWLTILFDVTKKEVLIVDALDEDEEEKTCRPELVVQLTSALDVYISALNGSYKIMSKCLNVQEDSYNCGVWALNIAAQFIEDKNFTRITSDHFSEMKIKESRKKYSTILYGK